MQREHVIKLALLSLTILLGLNLWILLQKPAHSDPSGRVSYKMFAANTNPQINLNTLNEFGKSGWRLVGTDNHDGTTIYYILAK